MNAKNGDLPQLIDQAIYRLPDGTHMRARVPLVGTGPRLETLGGQPAYNFDGVQGAWLSLRYDASIEGYAAAPCDLTNADLELVRCEG